MRGLDSPCAAVAAMPNGMTLTVCHALSLSLLWAAMLTCASCRDTWLAPNQGAIAR